MLIFNKLASVVMAVLALAFLVGACSADTSPAEVPTTIGLKGNKAEDALKKAGFKTKFVASGGETVWMGSHWVVKGQKPDAGTSLNKTSEVTLYVARPDDWSRDSGGKDTGSSATSTGLTGSYAQTACNAHGKNEFPYGFKPHWIMGKLADKIVDDQWFLKVEADVTNGFGASRSVNVECFVSGTNTNPIVTQFNAY